MLRSAVAQPVEGKIMNKVAPLESDSLARYLAEREPLYRVRSPNYPIRMIEQLASLWRGEHKRVLDVGGGTGLVAQCVADHFPVDYVHTVDVVNRFRSDLRIGHSVFDGVNLGFDDSSFDCAMMFNVLHHVAITERVPLLREIRRVAGRGPIYIKDHLALDPGDRVRLAILDVLGNVPFSGMIRASYLSEAEWGDLAAASGYQIAGRVSGNYRSGYMKAIFPNRLEISMRLEPLS
jgi:SAM-dependent methyltransferase